MLRLRASRLMQLVITMVWCGVVAARPMAMPCPVGGHGAHDVSAPAASEHVAAMPVHGDMHGDMHHGAPALDAPAPDAPVPDAPVPDAPTHAPGHQCDCLGHCCSTAVAMPATTPVVSSLVDVVSTAAPRAPHERTAAAWVDFVLPFAIAPPVGMPVSIHS